MILRTATALCLVAFSSVLWAAPPATDSKVVKLRRATVTTYVLEGDRFKRSAPLSPSALALPARVLKASGRGYVLVDANPQAVWLEKMDVEINPKLPLNARCISGVSTAADTTQGIVRGAGEGCRP